MKKPGRPKKEPTKVIAIPTDKIDAVEGALGRKVAPNQTPIVKIRVPVSEIPKIRKAMK